MQTLRHSRRGFLSAAAAGILALLAPKASASRPAIEGTPRRPLLPPSGPVVGLPPSFGTFLMRSNPASAWVDPHSIGVLHQTATFWSRCVFNGGIDTPASRRERVSSLSMPQGRDIELLAFLLYSMTHRSAHWFNVTNKPSPQTSAIVVCPTRAAAKVSSEFVQRMILDATEGHLDPGKTMSLTRQPSGSFYIDTAMEEGGRVWGRRRLYAAFITPDELIDRRYIGTSNAFVLFLGNFPHSSSYVDAWAEACVLLAHRCEHVSWPDADDYPARPDQRMSGLVWTVADRGRNV